MMPIQYVTGDPMLTQCQTLAIGHNRVGRSEMDALTTAIMRAYPTAFANYGRRCKQNRQAAGAFYLWTQSKPQLLFLTVRESSVGATRLRHVQSCLMSIARDYRLHNIQSLAIAPLGSEHDHADVIKMIETWFAKVSLPVLVYQAYQVGIAAE